MSALAYEGRPGCQSLSCRVWVNPDGTFTCIGWHCAVCDLPSSQYGHGYCHTTSAPGSPLSPDGAASGPVGSPTGRATPTNRET